MELKLCMNCMKEKKQDGPCPNCGFDENTYKPVRYQLPLQTIVGGKYIAGRVLEEEVASFVYLGWDIDGQQKVMIEECFGAGMAERNSGYRITPRKDSKEAALFDELKKFFSKEAALLFQFRHCSGIVTIKDFFYENNTAYIIKEYADGEFLSDILKKQPSMRFSFWESMVILEPILEFLEEIHRKGLVCGNISPSSIMINKKGEALLLKIHTYDNFIMETPGFLPLLRLYGYAPEEQYRGKGCQGPWTDIYIFCAVVYRMITGKRPAGAVDRFLGETLISPSELGAQIGLEQEEVLLKGMALLGKDRYQSIAEFKAALF